MDNLELGISINPVGILNSSGYVVCDNRPSEKLKYWNHETRTWVDMIFDSTFFPTEAAASNATYLLWEGYSVGDYKIVGVSAGLYPCTIKYEHDKTELYLKRVDEYQPFWDFDYTKTELVWTNNYNQSVWFDGPFKAVKVLFEVTSSLND